VTDCHVDHLSWSFSMHFGTALVSPSLTRESARDGNEIYILEWILRRFEAVLCVHEDEVDTEEQFSSNVSFYVHRVVARSSHLLNLLP
jgi:hypothetical protein